MSIQTNGQLNGSKKRISPEELVEIPTIEKRRKKRATSSNEQVVTEEKTTKSLTQRIEEVNNWILVRQTQRLKEKQKTLQQKLKESEQQIKNKEKVIRDLQEAKSQLEHLNKNLDKTVKRKFSSSNVLQLVEPTIIRSRNPIKALTYLKKYLGEKKQYKKLVREIDRIPFTFAEQREGGVALEHNPSKKILANSISVYERSMQVGEKWIRLYYLADLPPFLHPNTFFGIMAYPLPLQLSLYIKPTTKKEILKQVRRRIAILHAMQYDRERKGLTRDPEIDKAISEQDSFSQALVNEVERGFDYSLTCALIADSKEELDAMHKEFINVVEGDELTFNTYSFGQKQIFKNLLPFNEDHISEKKVLQTSAVSYLMPFIVKPLYDPKGIYLGNNYYHRSQIYIDPFRVKDNDIGNSNIVVVGQSGFGKSTTAKILANRLWMKDTQIIIIDPEREYTKLATALGGEIVRFSRDNGINPFYVHGKTEADVMDHVLTLKTFFKFFIPQGIYNSAEMDEYLVKLYKKDITQDFPTLLSLLEKDKSPMHKYLKILDDGSLKGIFTSKRSLELNNNLVVFDLFDLKKDEKRQPAMYLLTSLIWNLVNLQDERRRMLFIDEAHKLLTDPEVAIFYYEMVKVARKRNLGVVSITQDIKDFLGNQWGNAIVTNAETKIVHKQSYANLKYLDDLCRMSDAEKEEFANFAKGEAVLFRETERVRVNIHVLPFERKFAFTSNESTDGKNS